MDRPPVAAAAAVAFAAAAVTNLSTAIVPWSIAAVGTRDAVGTKECYYPWDCCTSDRPDSARGLSGTFESENGPERRRVVNLTEAKNCCNQTRPAMTVAYDGEVTMQSDH